VGTYCTNHFFFPFFWFFFFFFFYFFYYLFWNRYRTVLLDVLYSLIIAVNVFLEIYISIYKQLSQLNHLFFLFFFILCNVSRSEPIHLSYIFGERQTNKQTKFPIYWSNSIKLLCVCVCVCEGLGRVHRHVLCMTESIALFLHDLVIRFFPFLYHNKNDSTRIKLICKKILSILNFVDNCIYFSNATLAAKKRVYYPRLFPTFLLP